MNRSAWFQHVDLTKVVIKEQNWYADEREIEKA